MTERRAPARPAFQDRGPGPAPGTPPMRTLERGARGYPATSFEGVSGGPARLFAIGDTGLLDRCPDGAIAIVGTREASPYGIRVAQALGRAFASAGAVVVSGMARGIDAAAHHGALSAGGTIAVLGTGADVPYPAGSRSLHRKLCEEGLVLSESPPGTRAFKGCFPRRNRIIAALAKLTIVVEAGHKSGALNTASQALEMGRAVAAVPGPIDSPRSAGSNTLLRDGAHVITTVEDALSLAGLSCSATPSVPALGDGEADVWDALGGGGLSPDAISAATGLAVREVLEAVGKLELAGLISATGLGTFERLNAGLAGAGSRG